MVLSVIESFFCIIVIAAIVRHTSGTECLRNLTAGSSCVPLTTTSCLGGSISFTHTYLGFANDSSSLAEVEEKLKLWSGLQAAPKCWEVIQPFLCSVYMPKCDVADSKVEYPSKDLCEKTRDPCSIVAQMNGWPWFLQCDQPHFLDGCLSHTYETTTFNKTSHCNSPLVSTDNKLSWYEEVEGCGVQCQNPLFTEDEHEQVHIVIGVFGSLCLLCTLFTVLTFLIDWRNANKYPALILFFINICFFLGSIGWMAQFSGDARTDIVCKADGTIRKGEPGTGENASCVIVFILVYYTMMAGVVWFVMLAYAWHLTFKALGTPKDALANKTSYFHIASWCIPLVLTIICLAVSEIDGDSVSGICFVGSFNNAYRGGFVLAPIGLVLVIGLFFLCLVLRTLVKLKKDTPEYISMKASAKIKETIIRLGIFTVLAFTFVLITFAVHIYIFVNEQSWQDSFKDYIYCEANVTVTKSVSNTSTLTCEMTNRPSIAAYQIHILAFFGAGISMSSWSWTKASLLSWERFFRKIFNKPSNKPIKLKKHKIIAKAFEKRKEINNGRLSISFASTHDDPLGMKFDLNSMSSQNSMSSDFRAAMPKLVRRRGGMFHPTAGTLRRYSDSDVGSMASKMASRRQSLDSQISAAQGQFQHSDEEEEEEEVVYPGFPGQKKRRGRKKKKRRKNKRNRIQPVLKPIANAMASGAYGGRRAGRRSRRGSDNSSRSRMSAQGIELAMEKNSMEAVSITSYSHQNSLDAATLPEPPKHLKTNFAIFTASTYMGEMQSKLQNLESTDKSEIEEPPPPRRRERSGTIQPDSSIIQANAVQPDGVKRETGSRQNSASKKGSDKVQKSSVSHSRREGSASGSVRGRSKEIALEMAETFYSEKSKVSSASSRSSRVRDGSGHRQGSASSRQGWQGSTGGRQGSAGSRQGSAGGRIGSAGSRQGSLGIRQGSASSSVRQGSARSNRTSSAKSNNSYAMQLPGGTTVVQIEDEELDEISLT